MNFKQLRQVVREVEPRALLVAPRVLRRLLLRLTGRQPSAWAPVPHTLGWWCKRETLCQYVDEDELDLEADQLLPPTVILLPRPTLEELRNQPSEQLLLAYWRRLFHVEVQEALEIRFAPEHLSEGALQARIDGLGRETFEEIRRILVQEKYLAADAEDRATFCEFLSVYLEVRHFCPGLLRTMFPAVADWQSIEAIADEDVDSEKVFNRTRLPGAAGPTVRHDDRFDETHDYFWRLLKQADQARQRKDTVRTAVLHVKAQRIAPSEMVADTRRRLAADLEEFVQRLKETFRLASDQCRTWQEILPSLLEKVDHGEPEYELRLLEGLQWACVDHERRLYELNVVDWAFSFGRRPLQRPLSRVQLLRLGKHLRLASQRLPQLRLSMEEREQLRHLLEGMLRQTEARSRERFRPILEAAFRDVGLVASNPPERVALRKLIEELLDQIVREGFLTFSHLRDAVSRNQLKMADLHSAEEFRRGDPLARLDRTLKTLMDGVYHPAEFYLRGLERLSALGFGTAAGRFVCRNVLLPFGGSFLLLFVLGHLLHFLPVLGHLIPAPGVGCWFVGGAWLLLTHHERLRQQVQRFGDTAVGWMLHRLWSPVVRLWEAIDLDRWMKTWVFALAWWYLLAPIAVYQTLWILCPGAWKALAAAAFVREAAEQVPPRSIDPYLIVWWIGFLATNLLVNSRFGYLCGEALAEALQAGVYWFREDVLRQATRSILGFFKQVWAGLENLLYSVHDWLRATSDDDPFSYTLRVICSVLWAPFDYLIRILFVVVIEPNCNPIKLLISFLFAKMLVPFAPEMVLHLHSALGPLCGGALASMAAGTIVFWVIPGAGAFLVWEFQENRRLFRANRSSRLRAVSVGHHGETILELLHPGFHGGTVPKLFQQLRAAEQDAYAKGQWRAARTRRADLAVVSHAVETFVERELLALLAQSPDWPAARTALGEIRLTCGSIRIELLLKNSRRGAAWLRFDDTGGRLTGSLERIGWLVELDPKRQAIFLRSLFGFFHWAGVDFVPEQLQRAIPGEWFRYEASYGWVKVWEESGGRPVRYPLCARRARTAVPGADPIGVWDYEKALYSRPGLTWEEWVGCREKEQPLPAPYAELEEALLARIRDDSPPRTVRRAVLPADSGIVPAPPAVPKPSGPNGNGAAAYLDPPKKYPAEY